MALLWVSVASAAAAYFARDYLASRAPEKPEGLASAPLAPVLSPSTEFTVLDEPRALPDLRFQDGTGRSLRLSSFRGKAVLLNIWATWCGPCRDEMPALDRLQARLGGSDFQVIALSTDVEGATLVRKFYEDVGIERLGMYVKPVEKDMWALGLIGLPTTLLIDSEGRELGRKLGAAEWDSPQMLSLIQEHLEGEAPVAHME